MSAMNASALCVSKTKSIWGVVESLTFSRISYFRSFVADWKAICNCCPLTSCIAMEPSNCTSSESEQYI